MSVHLQRQFERVKKAILSLSAMVEEAVIKAIRAAETIDDDLATEVIDGDEQIDLMEIDVEEECLHTLALHQPVAFDLRFVVATLKINNDLERIGDLCVNIAEVVHLLDRGSMPKQRPFDLQEMGRTVRQMLKSALDALVNIDPNLAEQVIELDEKVDAMHRQSYQRVEQYIRRDPELTEPMIQYLSISRQLERMGDHCVNIAEDVLYMARGGIARHQQPPEA